jgi:hypothetical protein
MRDAPHFARGGTSKRQKAEGRRQKAGLYLNVRKVIE